MDLTFPTVLVPDWKGQAAHQLFCSRGTWQFMPSIPSTLAHLSGAAIISLAADDALCLEVAQHLGIEWRNLAEGGFAIHPHPQEQRLIILGGSRRGLLYGISTFLRKAVFQTNGILSWSYGSISKQPALQRSFYWTWDHSTNWQLMSAGQQEFGCNNVYTKGSDGFVGDYKTLIDYCIRVHIPAIVVYGFCRDSHGGVAASQEVCDYAAQRGIRILPGIGTSVYGGAYYASNHSTDTTGHPLSAKNFVNANPEAGKVNYKGAVSLMFPCPSHPKTIEWLRECARWLFQTFAIGGANLEHGDFELCYCSRCDKARQDQQQPAYYSAMTLSTQPFIDEALSLKPDAWIMYATYTGFVPEKFTKPFVPAWDDFTFEEIGNQFPTETWKMDCTMPEFTLKLDNRSIAQWTLTKMVNEKPLPLLAWLDDGQPTLMQSNDHWPAGLKPPTQRSVGFLHQGSQWDSSGRRLAGLVPRYTLQFSVIKEACLRAADAGLEGVAIHGEVSSQCIPYALNYLAHGYFSYYPKSSLRQFGRECLGEILGAEKIGERFVEFLAKAEAGQCDPKDLLEIQQYANVAVEEMAKGNSEAVGARFWRWLRVAAEPNQWEAAQVYQLTN